MVVRRFTNSHALTWKLWPFDLRSRKSARRESERRRPLLATCLHNQSLASLCPTTRQNFTSVFCGHAGTKSVSLFTPSTARLICTFWHCCSNYNESAPWRTFDFNTRPDAPIKHNAEFAVKAGHLSVFPCKFPRVELGAYFYSSDDCRAAGRLGLSNH